MLPRHRGDAVKLWLVRHARALVDAGICYGALDVEADPGKTRDAAVALAGALPPDLRARYSPLRRCGQLADALRALRPDLHFKPDRRLAEMDFGAWEGRSWDAIGQDALDRWTADFRNHRCGGAENVDLFMARVEAALADACRAGEDTLWVTHAGVARAVDLLLGRRPRPETASEWPSSVLGTGTAVCFDCASYGERRTKAGGLLPRAGKFRDRITPEHKG